MRQNGFPVLFVTTTEAEAVVLYEYVPLMSRSLRELPLQRIIMCDCLVQVGLYYVYRFETHVVDVRDPGANF